ncbi:MAG: hypothetical protein WBL11_06875 [Bacteroidales bacterium]|mgnify:CR=1 FL=1|jgi:hypothetical protein|nr:hypothetical protein [Bacteroidales bacterium]MDI9575151.1 hypothetical protein [Bacteroidota bacterium]MDD2592962.1 hypothetical protein [Bacteroidales bacterium]MDD3755733.1 hypothetical protein [Bacteroidales bacterium]MDY0400816.1 hypothetical protein [Bacteroidales bacterium]
MNIYRITQDNDTLIISYSPKEKLYRIYFNDDKIGDISKESMKNGVDLDLENKKIKLSLNGKYSNRPFIIYNDKIYSGEQEAKKRYKINLSFFLLWFILELIGAIWSYVNYNTVSFYIIFILVSSLVGIFICFYLKKNISHKVYLIIPLIFAMQIVTNISVNMILTVFDLIFISVFLYCIWEYSFTKNFSKFVLKKS